MAIPYTKKMLIQRVRKHVSDSRTTDDDFSASDNEILLLIDQAAAARIVGQTYLGAKVEGAICVPEAYLITYTLPSLAQDTLSGDWYTALPQPPLSLPLGYSVNRVYFKGAGYGQSQDAVAIKAKRVGRRLNMPLQTGIRYWVEGNTLWLSTSDGSILLGQQCYIQMPSARTSDTNAVMNMPEDDISFVFDETVKRLLQRYQIPQDIVEDGLGSGNKTS